MSQDDAPTPATQYAPQPRSGTSGWLIVLGVVTVLALGGLAAAIISKDDEGSATATTPSVQTKTTTVQQSTTTVTTPAPDVTVAPNITLDASGSPEPVQTGTQTSTAAKTTSTP
jgi:flagellar basal body-associated protein FliL